MEIKMTKNDVLYIIDENKQEWDVYIDEEGNLTANKVSE